MDFKHMALALTTAGLLTAGLLTAGIAQAQPEHGGWHHDGMEVLHSVDLTDAQKTEIHQIMKTTWSQMKPIMQQMHTVHEQIESDLFGTAAVTQEQLTPLVQQEEQLRAQVDAAKMSTALQIRGLLTPAQLAKAASVQQQLSALHSQERSVVGGGSETP